MTLRHLHHCIAASVLSGVCLAQANYASTTAGNSAVTSTTSETSASVSELQQLRVAVAEQLRQQKLELESLQQSNAKLAQQLRQTQAQLEAAEHKITEFQVQQEAATSRPHDGVNDATTSTVTDPSQEEKQRESESRDRPTAIRYKGITITPGGYFAGEAVRRNDALVADVSTPWANFPYDFSPQSHISEWRGSARNTRLSLSIDGNAGSSKLSGYFENDFLGTPFGTSVQTYGSTVRVRQAWARAILPQGWSFTAGQQWSLLTTNRKGIVNNQEWRIPQVDGTTFMGFDYARQFGFRVAKTLANDSVTVAFAAESSATNAFIPSNVPNTVSSQIAGLSSVGASGALSGPGPYSTDAAPDLIFKVAFDPGYGHYEIKTIGRVFRDRMTANATTIGHNHDVFGGGVGGAAILPISKKVEFEVQGMWGNVGRYGASQTDVIVKPTGGISPEKVIHWVSGFTTHLTPKLDFYAFHAGEYLYRNDGYGAPTMNNSGCFSEINFVCNPSTKSLLAANTGISYTLFQGLFGRFAYDFNYTAVYKTAWSGIGGSPRSIGRQYETSFRYYLP
jgi:hypothetical protein